MSARPDRRRSNAPSSPRPAPGRALRTPNVWDVAGGLALVRAAGGTVLAFGDGQWREFERFEAVAHAPEALADLRHWRAPLIIGQADAAALLARGG